MSFELMWSQRPDLPGRAGEPDAQGDAVPETNPKFFVKRMARKVAEPASALSGDEQIDSPRKQASERRRASTAKAAQSSKAVFGDLVEVLHPDRTRAELILGANSTATLVGVADEFRRGDEIRRHGLQVRSKLLFCGPPGCGKSLCAEVVAAELKMPLIVARLDAIIASHLGETASNLRKVFDAAQARPVVLFFDEFDALARARSDSSEHSEIKRVVNSLLMMIDRFAGRSLLIAATNIEQSIDRAIWRRFDEVVLFEKPSLPQIRRLLRLKTRNFTPDFDIARYAESFAGMSFAQIERTCLSAIRAAILMHKKVIGREQFETALNHEKRRATIESSVLA